MKLVVGLGNPGARYADTRHNVGFRVVASLAARWAIPLELGRFESRCGEGQVGPEPVLLLLPQTFMNASGRAVKAALDALPALDPAAELLVVTDDLDLPLGRLRLRRAGGAGGHNGLADVLAALDSRAVPRLRVGIGRGRGGDAIEHVLAAFDREEVPHAERAVEAAADAVEWVCREGVERAMDRVNRRSPAEPDLPPSAAG